MLTKRILIVDDEEGYRKVLTNSLTDIGYETKAVNNGLEALEEIRRKKYSIILLDVKMPGMDGIELLDRIQEIKFISHSNIVIITAYTDQDIAKEAVRKGAKKVITKPFSMDDIEACLSEL
ncbi:MAG: response regulator [Planctomycetes bacterium]|nr:response regulator [Planctomycetota bacterium]MDE1889459.1 response regulator [Planctomycetota bacterium]